jgi:hypothetical protein
MFTFVSVINKLFLEVIVMVWWVVGGYVTRCDTDYLRVYVKTSISITCLYVRRSVTSNRQMCRSGLITLYGICSGFKLRCSTPA